MKSFLLILFFLFFIDCKLIFRIEGNDYSHKLIKHPSYESNLFPKSFIKSKEEDRFAINYYDEFTQTSSIYILNTTFSVLSIYNETKVQEDFSIEYGKSIVFNKQCIAFSSP